MIERVRIVQKMSRLLVVAVVVVAAEMIVADVRCWQDQDLHSDSAAIFTTILSGGLAL